MNTETDKCPRCGAGIPGGAPQGLCPRCLMAGAAVPTGEVEAQNPAGRIPPPSLEEIAAAFPQLELIGLIGQGGMGVVYKALQRSLNRHVALKLLAPGRGEDPRFADRFQREARALAALSHPTLSPSTTSASPLLPRPGKPNPRPHFIIC
ncbi:MAG TPA: hypothetical protein DCY13_18930 [Verrucomicrobiales bacterium]|nr:hypothetical protein [Verrucomicrobiales bacterium]